MPKVPTPADAEPELPEGYVRARVLPKGHGRIHTGESKPMPIVRDDDERFAGLKGAAWIEAYEAAFARASVEAGLCHGKGAIVALPDKTARAYENKGLVEIV